MTRHPIACLVLAGLCLTGCAPKVFSKPGATQQDFVAAKYACEKDTRQTDFGTGALSGFAMRDFFTECMNAHGFYEKK